MPNWGKNSVVEHFIRTVAVIMWAKEPPFSLTSLERDPEGVVSVPLVAMTKPANAISQSQEEYERVRNMTSTERDVHSFEV